jgi:hypothetical protein
MNIAFQKKKIVFIYLVFNYYAKKIEAIRLYKKKIHIYIYIYLNNIN